MSLLNRRDKLSKTILQYQAELAESKPELVQKQDIRVSRAKR
ncbi:MAG: hypothetical protein WBY44_33985 [Bryobacteraceae bacterium]